MSAEELAAAQADVRRLERELAAAQARVSELETAQRGKAELEDKLALDEYRRYGRQMLVTGLPAQLALKRARVLVVGAGGLGSPVLLYLAAAGVGHLTLVEHDSLDVSNLHRQVIHSDAAARRGELKASSAARAVRDLNPLVQVRTLDELPFSPALIAANTDLRQGSFDIAVDCSDNAGTRYLLNAWAMAHSVPLVSGAAIRDTGVVAVYGAPAEGGSRGPCYACANPPPPRPSQPVEDMDNEARQRHDEMLALSGSGACSDVGVLGVLCGVVGTHMASLVLRMITRTDTVFAPAQHYICPLEDTPMRTFKSKRRKADCLACSDDAKARFEAALQEYEATGEWRLDGVEWASTDEGVCTLPRAPDPNDHRIEPHQAAEHMIIDVRSQTEFGICALPRSTSACLELEQSRVRDHSQLTSSVCRCPILKAHCRSSGDFGRPRRHRLCDARLPARQRLARGIASAETCSGSRGTRYGGARCQRWLGGVRERCRHRISSLLDTPASTASHRVLTPPDAHMTIARDSPWSICEVPPDTSVGGPRFLSPSCALAITPLHRFEWRRTSHRRNNILSQGIGIRSKSTHAALCPLRVQLDLPLRKLKTAFLCTVSERGQGAARTKTTGPVHRWPGHGRVSWQSYRVILSTERDMAT